MARRPFVSAVLGLALLAGTSARAGMLVQATWLQVAQGVPLTRTLSELSASGTSTASSIAVALTYPFFSTNFFVPKTANGAIDLALHVTQGGPQLLTATAGMANGSPGIPGTVVIMTAAHVAMGASQSMFKVGVNTLVAVPLSNGKAGQFTATFTIINLLHRMTVDFYAWTPGTVALYDLSSQLESLPPVTAMGAFTLTAMGGGLVTLVSPSKVSIDGPLAQRRTATFTTLKLAFVEDDVPEPGSLLLLAGAAVALGLGTRRRH